MKSVWLKGLLILVSVAVLGPLTTSDTDSPVLHPQRGSQAGVFSAGDGGYLAVWRWDPVTTASGVAFTRLLPDGRQLDPAAKMLVSPTLDGAGTVAAAWGGSNWMVVWNSGSGNRAWLRAARIAEDGQVIDQPPRTLLAVDDTCDCIRPRIAANGREYLVAWPQQSSTGPTERFIRLGPDGTVLGAPTETGPMAACSVASNGADFLLACVNGSTVPWATRISASGAVLDSPPIALDTQIDLNAVEPAAVWDGANYLVVWSGLRGRRIDSDGGLLEASPFGLGSGMAPRAASDGVITTVAYQHPLSGDPGFVEVSRIRRDGVILDTDSVVADLVWGGRGDVAMLRDQALIGFGDEIISPTLGYSVPILLARTMDGAGAPRASFGPVVVIPQERNSEANPAVASTATHTLVVWADSREAWGTYGEVTWDLYGIIDGQKDSAAKPAIKLAAASMPLVRPALATDGVDFAMAWQARGSFPRDDIFFERVRSDGGPPDAPAVAIGHGEFGNLAAGGGTYVVVWRSGTGVVATPILGRDAGNPIVLSGLSRGESNPRGTWAGDRFLVAWERDNPADLYGIELGTNGSTTDGGAFAISTAPGNQTRAALASDEGRTLIVFEDDRSGVAQIRGVLLGGDAGVDPAGAGFVLAASAAPQRNPVVTFDGRRFVVAWEEGDDGGMQIRGAVVSRSGEAGFPVQFSGSSAASSPGLAAADGGVTVVWSEARLEPQVQRVVTAPFDCIIDSDCAPRATECTTARCTASMTCTLEPTNDGQPCGEEGICGGGVCSILARSDQPPRPPSRCGCGAEPFSAALGLCLCLLSLPKRRRSRR